MFLRQEIDLRTFASLNDDDLKEIGIQTFGARKKLILLANSKTTMKSVSVEISAQECLPTPAIAPFSEAKQAFQQKW